MFEGRRNRRTSPRNSASDIYVLTALCRKQEDAFREISRNQLGAKETKPKLPSITNFFQTIFNGDPLALKFCTLVRVTELCVKNTVVF